MTLFDPYEIRARVIPAILVSLSPIITCIALLSLLNDTPDLILRFILGGSVVVVFIYVFTFVVRYLGRKYEPQLWEDWDGPPSTRFLRWRDSTFDDRLKQKLHHNVKQVLGISLLSREEEENDPSTADERISQAFLQVRALVRKEDQNGLWQSHNAEYGYHRNLVGSRKLWLFLTVIGTIICGGFWYLCNNDSLLFGFIINVMLLIGTLLLGWYFLPKSAKIASDCYGESMWSSFLTLTDERKQMN